MPTKDSVLTRSSFYAILIALALMLSYILLGRIVLLAATPSGYAAAFFPSAGIALVGLCVYGVRFLPFVFCGSFLLNLWPSFATEGTDLTRSILVAGVIALGASLQAFIGSFLANRAVSGRMQLRGAREILLFLLFGGPFACLCNAVIGPLGLVFLGVIESTAFLSKAWTWWVGDTFGVLVVAPFLMPLLARPREIWRSRIPSVSLPILVSCVLVSWVYADVNAREKSVTVSIASDRANNLKSAVDGRLQDILRELADFSSLDAMRARRFDAMAFGVHAERILARTEALEAIAWIPTDGSKGTTARVSAVYPETWLPTLGSELGSDSQITDAIRKAEIDDATRLFAVRSLTIDLQDRAALIALRRVTLPASGETLGYLATATHIDALMESVFRQHSVADTRIDLRLLNAVANDPSEVIAYTFDGIPRSDASEPFLLFQEKREIHAGGLTFQISQSLDPLFVSFGFDSRWRILALGTLFTGGLGIALLVITGGRARAEEIAAEFEVITENVPQLLWASRGDGTVPFMNKRWITYTGLTPSDIHQRADHLHPDERNEVLAKSRKARERKEQLDLLIRLRRADGAYRWHKVQSHPFSIAGRDENRRFGSCSDVHDEVLRIHELEAARESLALANTVAGVAAWEFDFASGTLTREESHDLLFGFDAKLPRWEIDAVLARIHREDRDDVRLRMEKSLRPEPGEDGYDMTFRVSLPSGECRWLYFVARFIRSPQGEVTHHRGIIVNITNVKEMEKERIDAEVRERSARASEQIKSEFVAMVSHELRTPLWGILGFTDALKRTRLDDEQSDLVRNLSRSGASLLRIINDVLDLSKIEAGKLDFEWVPFDLREILEDVASAGKLLAEAKGISFCRDTASVESLTVRGDPTRLRQVLGNLVSNAVKFTAVGKVGFGASISLDSQEADFDSRRARVKFDVSDTGIGLSSRARSRLFQRFSQADESTARRFGGTGLGLSICKDLVAGMGGSIEVDSTEGLGSTFTVYLEFPLESKSLEPEAHLTTTLSNPSPVTLGRQEPNLEPDTKGTLRILIAEDIDLNRMILEPMLRKLGYESLFVENGQEAINAFENFDASGFSLVLMDCQMPGMDGYEATRRIRSHPKLGRAVKEIPIIAMTANARESDRERCFASGMDDHIAKPFNLGALADTLAQWHGRCHEMKGRDRLGAPQEAS